MKKTKICITGSLGYLGTELCKLYSGEARYKDIICIDNRFISQRVTQFRQWGMTFIQGSILDKDLMQQHLHDADIVYHLAGITDVAYTKTQSTDTQDELIRSVGIDGTRNILDIIPSSCKIIFPSTHVVFEGLAETKFDISESENQQPVLTYSQGKVQSENDIRAFELIPNGAHTIATIRKHIILRLGSVYGYSTDTMRINIMPNLFSKIASQDGTISLFSGGKQWKSLVNVIDVVRAMKFLAESDHTGTYHLSNENMTIRQIAEICQSINSKVTLVDTTDEVPNLGYTLSNNKLLSTGFKFLYNIRDSIQEMISKWSYHNTDTPLEYIQTGGNEYIDERGIIRNYELTEPINLIGYIFSRTGTVRANHYHPIQEQKCLLLSGRYVSVIKDLSYPDAPLEYKVIHPGDIAVIRPNVAHTMVFLQDSIFLNLVNGEREHANYGITHTIPYELVDAKLRSEILGSYTTQCRCCGCTDLQVILSLGMSPLANNLLDSIDQQCDMYPLELEYCPNCYNVQLSIVVPAAKMFDNYLYVSSTSQIFRQHFEQAADHYIQMFNLGPQSLVLDIGSNDGIALKPLQTKGIRVIGIEPATNIATLANTANIPTINSYFNQDSANLVYQGYGSPDLITASNVFAHAHDLIGITNDVFALIKQGGVFIVEVQYLIDTIRDLTFDNIYHEHVNYWSVYALNTMMSSLGNTLFHVEHIDTHGGSIRCYICRDNRAIDPSVQQFLDTELQQGINSIGLFKLFAKQVHDIRATVRTNIQLLKSKFNTIVGYGSPAKATTALNYFGITSDDIKYTLDDNLLKQSKYIPNTGIQIVQNITGSDLVIVLAWNFYDSIKTKLGNTSCISIKDLEIPDMPIMDTKCTKLIGTMSTGKVYDCFLFFNELDLLELRFNILDSIVDYFVIVEANITHSGVSRDYCYEANKSRFTKWSDKIIYIQVINMPNDFTNLGKTDSVQYNQIVDNIKKSTIVSLNNPLQCREYWQRESIIWGLQNAQPDDVIMLSDIDEIPNPDTLRVILDNFDNIMIYSLRQNSYYYYLNALKEKHWVGPRLSSYTKFQEQPVGTFRHIRETIVADGGWHWSFQQSSGVVTKLQAYSHSDMANEDVMAKLDNRITTLQDPFGRPGKLKLVPIDNTYPQYLLANLDKYKSMIL